jgi:peptidoglycan-N-acetylglucosamine deacetylase
VSGLRHQPYGITITIDVEDHATSSDEYRFREAMVPLMEALQQRGVVATLFVVGSLASAWRDEMTALAAAGHEIGLHGYSHRFLAKLGPATFADELARGRDLLGELVGRAPVGFRAPYFSLTPETPWAPDLIADAGFTYSSSVLPINNFQAGFPRAPKVPFTWPCGLVEFPSPVLGMGTIGVPVLGGAYLRLAPAPLVWLAARRARHHSGAWSYSHPYDFDVEEPFKRHGDQSWLLAKLLFTRRRLMLGRVLRLAGSQSRSLGSLASDAEFRSCLPSFAGFTG